MADGPYRFQQGAGAYSFYQHNQQTQSRHLPQRSTSPTGASGRLGLSADSPSSPARSPGPQSPPHNSYGMFNQNHAQQTQHAMMNGNNGRHFTMSMNLQKHFQNQAHQNQGHQHQQHQDHNATGHGGNYGGHHHNISAGGLTNATPHFTPGHMHNNTPGSTNSALNKAPNEHWAEQLSLAQRAREMTMSHSHARNNPGTSKNVIAGNSNLLAKEPEKEERNRVVSMSNDDSASKQIWTTLDLGGQNLKVISAPLFAYTFLTKLYVNCNKLTQVSPLIGQLRSLTHVDLSLNDIQKLPPEIGMLVNLRQLLLFDNQLVDLPYEMGSLYQLEMLGIEGNPLQEDVKQVVMEQGTVELIKFFRENAEGPAPPADRDWIEIDDTVTAEQEKCSVLTYNTLCDIYATQTQYGYTPSAALAWDHRKELILEELRTRNADIMCLQEINSECFNDYLRGALAHNDYKGIWWPRPKARTMSEKDARLVDGCAIFYKNSKYVLLDKQLIDFCKIAINRPDMKGEHDIFNRVMPKDHIAIIAFLENRVTGSRLIVGNAHMHWDPNFSDVKVVQTAILMEQLAKFAELYAKFPPCTDKGLFRYANGGSSEDDDAPPPPAPGPSLEYSEGTQIPLIICGDFNSMRDSGVYDLITRGSLPPDHPDLMHHKYGDFTKEGMSHPFNLKSSYESMGDISFTNYTPAFQDVIDYIWYSSNGLSVSGLLGDIDKEYMQRVPGFPNYHFPSDHIALLAEFVVKARKEKRIVEADFGPSRDRRQ